MVELIGDICEPSEFILPSSTTREPTIAGEMVISGTEIFWFDGSSLQKLSGSNTGD